VNDVFMAIDLELSQPQREIIELGAVVGNLRTGEVLEEKNWYVNVGYPLSDFIVSLTGITDDILQSQGVTLKEAYEGLCEMHKRNAAYRNPIVWGIGDTVHLREELKLDDEVFLFGRRFWDVKGLFQAYMFSQGKNLPSGLKKSMQRMGEQFDGKPHGALPDARNTFKMGHLLIKKFRP
jgi:inhibitor of KinA sporulation pathway (predicted exonuclease)